MTLEEENWQETIADNAHHNEQWCFASIAQIKVNVCPLFLEQNATCVTQTKKKVSVWDFQGSDSRGHKVSGTRFVGEDDPTLCPKSAFLELENALSETNSTEEPIC